MCAPKELTGSQRDPIAPIPLLCTRDTSRSASLMGVDWVADIDWTMVGFQAHLF
jgi:hypothetical protein